MNPELEAFKDIFLEEVEEQLQAIESHILELEQDGASTSCIQSLFRAAHTLKGSSAAMGFLEMSNLTHEMEHVLDDVRHLRLEVTVALINQLFRCLDALKLLQEEFRSGSTPYTSSEALVLGLRSLKEGGCLPEEAADASSREAQSKAEESSNPFPLMQLDAEAKIRATAMAANDTLLLLIRVKLSDSSPMKGVRAYICHNRLAELGEVIASQPSTEDMLVDNDLFPSHIQFLLAPAGVGTADIELALAALMDVEQATAAPFSLAETELIQAERAAAAETPQQTGGNAPAEAKAATDKRKTQTIRVDVERLEHLMNLIGELIIGQTRFERIGTVLGQQFSGQESIEDLQETSSIMSRVVGDLQESVLRIRMQPLEQLFNRFPRMVRDLSQTLHKEVDLVIEGKDTELDRTVLEEIGDPIIHLLRNSIDHGIEPGEERERKGKPRRGTLTISASHEENHVVLSVIDDGAGIRPDVIKAAAVKKGLITPDEAAGMGDHQAIRLIFKPGFSTASKVTDVSGRGVGMDIVRDHIEKLNGLIDIQSEPDKGTKFTIKLPLTLAIITGLMVRLSQRSFVIPMSNVAEIVRVPKEQIATFKGKPVITIRDHVIPVAWLHDCFGMSRTETDKKHLPIVIIGSGERRLALVVDELDGNQDIVVKSLGAYVGTRQGISGATILGDGRVALILEVSGLMELARRN